MPGGLNQLINQLTYEGVLRTPNVIHALKTIDRKDFVPPEYTSEAFGDYPIPIGFGQTVPQPNTTIFMLEHLKPRKGQKILDIGSGSGWTTALLGDIVGDSGHVYGVEIVPELVAIGRKNIAKYSLSHVEILQASKALGLQEHAPYDRILVSACCEELPSELVQQLRIGGRMIIPIGDSICRVNRKSKTKTDTKKYKGFAFVPLIY